MGRGDARRALSCCGGGTGRDDLSTHRLRDRVSLLSLPCHVAIWQYLIDSSDIEHIWQTMWRHGFYRGGPVFMSALSGIDIALWDLKGETKK